MSTEIYIRTKENTIKHRGQFKKGMIPWNKGKKGVQKAWNKGKHLDYMQGKNHPMWGKSPSEETREKMRQAKIKKPTNYWLGKKRSKEDKIKMSLSKIGKKHSEETKRKIAIIHLGKKRSKETCQKISQSKIGKKRSEETKQKLREWNINNPRYKNKDTNIELKVEKELQKRNILYKKHFPLLRIANVDFYLPYYDAVIQCDGCYWHNCLTHSPNGKIGSRDKDERQDMALEEEGITVYRLWEHEINYPEIKYRTSITIDMVLNYLINK